MKDLIGAIGLSALVVLGIVLLVALGIGIAAGFNFLLWFIYMNTLVTLFGAPALTFLQFWGISFLLGCFLGMFRSVTTIHKD